MAERNNRNSFRNNRMISKLIGGRNQSIALLLFLIVITTMVSGCNDSVLSGTSWELQSFGPIGMEKKVLSDRNVTLEFALDGKTINGYGGCNRYSANYNIGVFNTLSIGSIITTLMFCESTSEQEHQYLTALRNVSAFEVDQDRLQLFYNDRKGVLNFSISKE